MGSRNSIVGIALILLILKIALAVTGKMGFFSITFNPKTSQGLIPNTVAEQSQVALNLVTSGVKWSPE